MRCASTCNLITLLSLGVRHVTPRVTTCAPACAVLAATARVFCPKGPPAKSNVSIRESQKRRTAVRARCEQRHGRTLFDDVDRTRVGAKRDASQAGRRT